MKTSTIDCIRSLLPEFVASWLGNASTGAAVAVGAMTLNPAIAGGLAAAGICAYLGISYSASKNDKRSEDFNRKAITLTRQYALSSNRGIKKLTENLAEIGYQISINQDTLDQRIEMLDGLANQQNANHECLISFFEKHESLFVALADFLEDNFELLKEALNRQDLVLADLYASSRQLLIQFALLQKDCNLLAERLVNKYEQAEHQMLTRINEQQEMIAAQRAKINEDQQKLLDRQRRIVELESSLRRALAAADAGDANAEAAIEAIRLTGDIKLLRDARKRFNQSRRQQEVEQAQVNLKRYCEECLEIASLSESIGDLNEAKNQYLQVLKEDPNNVEAIDRIARVYYITAEIESAERCWNRLLELHGDKMPALATCSSNLGLIAQLRGDYSLAKTLYLKALVAYEAMDYLVGQAIQYGNLGVLNRLNGELEIAEQYHLKSLTINRKVGRLRGQAIQLKSLGVIAAMQNDYDKAEGLFTQALDIFRETDSLLGQADCLGDLGTNEQTRGNYVGAEPYYIHALEIYSKMDCLEGPANIFNNLGNMSRKSGDLNNALAFYNVSLGLDRKLGNLVGQANTLEIIGIIYQTSGYLEKSKSYYVDSLKINQQLGNISKQAGNLSCLGYVARECGENENAKSYWSRGIQLYSEAGMNDYADDLRALMVQLEE